MAVDYQSQTISDFFDFMREKYGSIKIPSTFPKNSTEYWIVKNLVSSVLRLRTTRMAPKPTKLWSMAGILLMHRFWEEEI